jgi:ABC-2 type transport system ATP-binding protein
MSDRQIIRTEHLTKLYGGTVGIQDLSLSVARGETFGFLGPNGAGKTTTIRLVLDLLKPTSGSVALFGRPVARDSVAVRRRCGYLPGDFSAYGTMRAGEYLDFIFAMRKAEPEWMPGLLKRFRLAPGDLGRRVKQLSHGTQQKLGIIQAFAHRPALVVLDEPTTGLDPLMQEELYALLREYQGEGGTVFFSSHNLPEVEKTCQRVAIVRDGQLVALETLTALKEKQVRRLRVRFERELGEFQLPGASLERRQGNEYEFLYRGDLGPLLSRLAQLPVTDLVFPEPDLEEVFRTYYRSGANG